MHDAKMQPYRLVLTWIPLLPTAIDSVLYWTHSYVVCCVPSSSSVVNPLGRSYAVKLNSHRLTSRQVLLSHYRMWPGSYPRHPWVWCVWLWWWLYCLQLNDMCEWCWDINKRTVHVSRHVLQALDFSKPTPLGAASCFERALDPILPSE